MAFLLIDSCVNVDVLVVDDVSAVMILFANSSAPMPTADPRAADIPYRCKIRLTRVYAPSLVGFKCALFVSAGASCMSMFKTLLLSSGSSFSATAVSIRWSLLVIDDNDVDDDADDLAVSGFKSE